MNEQPEQPGSNDNLDLHQEVAAYVAEESQVRLRPGYEVTVHPDAPAVLPQKLMWQYLRQRMSPDDYKWFADWQAHSSTPVELAAAFALPSRHAPDQPEILWLFRGTDSTFGRPTAVVFGWGLPPEGGRKGAPRSLHVLNTLSASGQYVAITHDYERHPGAEFRIDTRGVLSIACSQGLGALPLQVVSRPRPKRAFGNLIRIGRPVVREAA